jgi:hypothetical protein
MGIVTKNIGNGSYAYRVAREGDRVIHKYLGSVKDPRVRKLISAWKESVSVPSRFSTLFWDTDTSNIHLRKNARYVIERVLEMGDLDAVNWLQRVYTVQKIIEVLSTSRAISRRSRLFWKLWFGVNDA